MLPPSGIKRPLKGRVTIQFNCVRFLRSLTITRRLAADEYSVKQIPRGAKLRGPHVTLQFVRSYHIYITVTYTLGISNPTVAGVVYVPYRAWTSTEICTLHFEGRVENRAFWSLHQKPRTAYSTIQSLLSRTSVLEIYKWTSFLV